MKGYSSDILNGYVIWEHQKVKLLSRKNITTEFIDNLYNIYQLHIKYSGLPYLYKGEENDYYMNFRKQEHFIRRKPIVIKSNIPVFFRNKINQRCLYEEINNDNYGIPIMTLIIIFDYISFYNESKLKNKGTPKSIKKYIKKLLYYITSRKHKLVKLILYNNNYYPISY